MQADELQMLEGSWFPVARLDDIRGHNPFGGRLLGTRVVVFRDTGGVGVAVDSCPHRGATLSNGRIQDGVLECPYHGWRWRSDGSCALVPSQPSAHPNATLRSLPIAERFGLVWACLGSPLREPPSIPETDGPDEGWEISVGTWFDVACGLRSITENFRDSSHFAFVHRDTFGDVNPAVPAYTVEREGWRLSWTIRLTFGAEWASAPDGRPRSSKYRFGETEGDDGRTEQMALNYRFEVPSLAYVFTEHAGGGRRLVAQAAAPIESEGSACRVFWFVAANERFRHRFGPLQTQLDIEAKVFSEDVPIVEGLDPLEAPLGLDGQTHVRADRYSVAYRRMYASLVDASHRLTSDVRGR